MRGDRVDQPVGADRGRPVGVDLDAEIDVGVADHQRLAFQIAAAERAQIEQRRRHDGGDDRGGRGRRRSGPASCRSWLQPDGVFVGRARRLGDGAPFGADLARRRGRRRRCWCCRRRWRAAWPTTKNTSPAVMRAHAVRASRAAAARRLVEAFEHAHRLLRSCSRARMRVPRPAARASQASRIGAKPSAAPDVIPFREVRRRGAAGRRRGCGRRDADGRRARSPGTRCRRDGARG